MSERQTLGERMAKVESWVDGHEKLCAERYGKIEGSIVDLKGMIRWASRGVWAAALSLMAWMAVQLYDGHRQDLRELRAAQAEAAAPR